MKIVLYKRQNFLINTPKIVWGKVSFCLENSLFFPKSLSYTPRYLKNIEPCLQVSPTVSAVVAPESLELVLVLCPTLATPPVHHILRFSSLDNNTLTSLLSTSQPATYLVLSGAFTFCHNSETEETLSTSLINTTYYNKLLNEVI